MFIQVCCVTRIVKNSCRMFCELSINFGIIFQNVQCIPCFFYLCVCLYHRGFNHLSFSRVSLSYVLIQ